jgi:putative transferase (TIGR04331 family)
MKFSLVIGQNELLWPLDGHVVVVDDYCNRFISDSSVDRAKVVTSHSFGLDRISNQENYMVTKGIYEKLLDVLQVELNKYHKLDESKTYWEGIISHWLFRAVQQLVISYLEIKVIVDTFEIDRVIICQNRINQVTPKDSWSFAKSICEDELHIAIRSEVIRELCGGSDKTTIFEVEMTSLRTVEENGSVLNIKQRLVKLLSCVDDLLNVLIKRDRLFIKDTYLPFWQERKLQLSFLQSPIPKQSKIVAQGVNVCDDRESMFDQLDSSDELEMFVQKYIGWLIPRSYLEDFVLFKNSTNQCNWPKNPSVIFTANAYDSDDFFKIWVAEKRKFGAKLVVMQHGNNFGTHKFVWQPEVASSDAYLTWGWTKGENTVPAFCQTISKSCLSPSDESDELLFLLNQLPMRLTVSDHPSRVRGEHSDIDRFVSELDRGILSNMRVKDHPGNKYRSATYSSASELIRVANADAVDRSSKRKNLYSNSRLVVFGYYSTGFLECIALDHPTIAFWQDGFDNFSEDVICDFELLKAAGLIHFSPSLAAEHVNTHWNDINSWWSSVQVQEAKKLFMRKYARTCDTPVRSLKRMLVGIAEKSLNA